MLNFRFSAFTLYAFTLYALRQAAISMGFPVRTLSSMKVKNLTVSRDLPISGNSLHYQIKHANFINRVKKRCK